ncbi:MAG TPA: hypothetical protein VK824_05335, partial [Planctomycetota bacterium]|nr:hypothetical protein [Planctomycetota bacterium]
ALFALLGTLLFSVVRGAMDLWATGERNREFNDRGTAALDLLAEDLRTAWPGLPGAAEQDARFLVVPRSEERVTPAGAPGAGASSGTGAPSAGVPNFSLLAFARLCHEERSLDWLRRAGDTPGAQGTASLAAPSDPEQLQPTGGLAEALFVLAVPPGETLPSLVRCVRTPLGGTGSLLDPESWTDREARARDGVAIADRVLWFGVLCWTPQTTCWERQPGDPAEAVPALAAWDSTRGLALAGAEDFPYAAGPASLHDGSDDVFPQRVKLCLVLERGEGEQAAGALADELTPQATGLVVGSARFLDDERPPDFLLADDEWMGVASIDGRNLVVTRGARGTRPASHAAGTPVRAGRRFDRVIELPCAKENWNR